MRLKWAQMIFHMLQLKRAYSALIISPQKLKSRKEAFCFPATRKDDTATNFQFLHVFWIKSAPRSSICSFFSLIFWIDTIDLWVQCGALEYQKHIKLFRSVWRKAMKMRKGPERGWGVQEADEVPGFVGLRADRLRGSLIAVQCLIGRSALWWQPQGPGEPHGVVPGGSSWKLGKQSCVMTKAPLLHKPSHN